MCKTLFDEFGSVSAKAWKQKIQYDLKREDSSEELVWELPEQIKVKPFYHLDDPEPTYRSAQHRQTSLKIAQEIFVENNSKSNTKALNSL